MSGRLTQEEEIERDVVADRLNEIAGALREGGDMRVRVGNKTVTLHPPEEVSYSIDVVETKRRFRGNRESVEIELDWKPDSPAVDH